MNIPRNFNHICQNCAFQKRIPIACKTNDKHLILKQIDDNYIKINEK